MRYLSFPVPSNKVIGQPEYDRLAEAFPGAVGLNWEYDSRDWLTLNGAAYGTKAGQLAKALGHPSGKPIPSSADFDMTWGQWLAVGKKFARDYSHAVNDQGYAAGVYSHRGVLEWCAELGGFDMYWQSMSTGFFGGQNATMFPGVHLWQRYSFTIGGISMDHNDLIREDWNGMASAALDLSDKATRDAAFGIKDIIGLTDPSERADQMPNKLAQALKAIQAAQTGQGSVLTALQQTLAAVADLATDIDTKVTSISVAPPDPAAVAANIDYAKLAGLIAGHIKVQ